ncbi:MAG: CHASE2 domain-containing serine/threonine-protein kinase [Gloeomargarita sp. DG02_5_bins_242]
MKFRGWQAGVAAGVVTAGVALLDAAGGFTGLELGVYDRFLRWQPLPDARTSDVVVVAIRPEDLPGRERISDRELQALLQKLIAAQVAVVGVDVIRDVPVGSGAAGQKDLVQLVNRQADAPQGNIILTCLLPEAKKRGVLPPPGLQNEQQVVGFADRLPDGDQVVRRHLLFVQTPEASAERQTCQARYSLGFLTALTYLHQQGYRPTISQGELSVGKRPIRRLSADAGPYRGLDSAGYQVFWRYRRLALPSVTMTQVLQAQTPMPLRNRLVLVGYAGGLTMPVTTPLGKVDLVVFHAQSAAQVLRVVLDGESLLWWWPRWAQGLWLWLWSGLGAWVGWRLQRRWDGTLLLAPGLLILLTWGVSMLGGWLPLVAPGLAWLGTGLWVWWWLPRPLAVLRPQLSLAVPGATTLDPKGRYANHKLLSEDGLGWVYEALDQHVGKRVVMRVLKLLPSPQRRAELRQTFVAQVERYVALDNLHLIQILDFGLTKQGFPFYVREYLPGVSLQQRLRDQQQLSPLRAVYLVRQICKGLEPAHAQGWVHHDLKPENIFLIPTGAKPPLEELVKILDFGLTQWINDSTANTAIAANASSFPYMAPELLAGTTAQPSADVYSLGVLLYRLISGHYPFPLTDTAPFSQWCHAHQHLAPTPLTSPATAQGLEPILHRCLAKAPHDRYPNATALEAALQTWQTQQTL